MKVKIKYNENKIGLWDSINQGQQEEAAEKAEE